MLRVPAQTPGAPSCQDEGDAVFPSPKPEVPEEESQTKSYPRLERGKRELGILGKVFSWRCLASGHGKSFRRQVRVQQDPVLLWCWKKNWRPPRQHEKGEGEKGVPRSEGSRGAPAACSHASGGALGQFGVGERALPVPGGEFGGFRGPFQPKAPQFCALIPPPAWHGA